MFYTGSLSSGLGQALAERKLVACLVTDDTEESRKWELEYLRDPTLETALRQDTVLLRLVAGSSEASYLAAIVPLPKTPTFVVIDNGHLKEYIVPKISRDSFRARVLAVLPSASGAGTVDAQPTTVIPSGDFTTQENAQQQSYGAQGQQEQIAQDSTSTSEVTSTSANPPSAVQTLLAERSLRLEAQKRKEEAQEQQRRKEQAKAQKEAAAASSAATPTSSEAVAAQKHAQAQKKRREDAKAERARILRMVEDDKITRRERSAASRSQIPREEESTAPVSELPRSRDEVALQVRLFDGSLLRARLPANGSLSAHLRPLIRQRHGTDTPYTFKQVLNPLPNKDITTGQEERTFADLDLLPSATFILVPMTSHVSAYQSPTFLGLIKSYVWACILFLMTGMANIKRAVTRPSEETTRPIGSTDRQGVRPSPNPSHSRAATLQDQRKDDQQFYNGNALNFEPRIDDEDKIE